MGATSSSCMHLRDTQPSSKKDPPKRADQEEAVQGDDLIVRSLRAQGSGLDGNTFFEFLEHEESTMSTESAFWMLYDIYTSSKGYVTLFQNAKPSLPGLARLLEDRTRFKLMITSTLAAFGHRATRIGAQIGNLPPKLGVRHCSSTAPLSRLISDAEMFLIAQSNSTLSRLCSDDVNASLLFSGNRDGESWIRCLTKIEGYPGLVLFVVDTEDRGTCGAIVHGGLKESGTKYFGSSLSCLFGLAPEFRLYPASGSGSHFVLINRQSVFVPTGIGFGGEEDSFRLFISSSLREVKATVADSTYRGGALLDMRDGEDGSERFEIETRLKDLEVWGIGSLADLEEQRRFHDLQEELKAEKRHVDRAKFADDRNLLKTDLMNKDRQGEVESIVEDYRKQEAEKSKPH